MEQQLANHVRSCVHCGQVITQLDQVFLSNNGYLHWHCWTEITDKEWKIAYDKAKKN